MWGLYHLSFRLGVICVECPHSVVGEKAGDLLFFSITD